MPDKPKYLFHFSMIRMMSNGEKQRVGFEVFAETVTEAKLKISLILGDQLKEEHKGELGCTFITENFECPKCSTNVTVESECRL